MFANFWHSKNSEPRLLPRIIRYERHGWRKLQNEEGVPPAFQKAAGQKSWAWVQKKLLVGWKLAVVMVKVIIGIVKTDIISIYMLRQARTEELWVEWWYQ